MLRGVFRSVLAAVAAIALTCSLSAKAETVRIAGSGTVYQFLQRVSADFTRQTGIEVENIQNLASSGSLTALTEGVIDIAVSGQLLSEEETARGLKAALTLRTPFVLATSHPQPQSLSIADVVEAYATGKTWSDGTPVRVILRPKKSIATGLMEQFSPELLPAMDKARRRADIPVGINDIDTAEIAERTPGSLACIALLQLTSEKRKLNPITLDGIAPTLENFDRGLYKYYKPLAFVVSANVKPAAERLLKFIRSEEGQDIYRRASGY